MTHSTVNPRRIHLLGTFEIVTQWDVPNSAAWRSQQNRTILKFLFLHRRHVVPSDRLLEILWPDQDPEVTRSRLYVRISQARRMLDPENPHAAIQSVAGGYCFYPDPVWWVDVDAFEAAAERGRRAQERDALTEAIANYEEARLLYRGDLLEEDRYADWTFAERERLLERYLTLLTELAEAYAQQGRYRRAISTYQDVLERDPYREAVFVRLMLTYYHAGEQTQALRTFERCRRALAEGMDVAPMPATQALAEQIRTGSLSAREGLPHYPPPTYQGRLFEIPYSLGRTPFVGRELEYAWLISRWQEARPGFVLVEGEAGVGKTRLIEEALGFAHIQRAHILRVLPSPEGTAMPYAPLARALRPLWQSAAGLNLPAAHRKALEKLFTPSKRSPVVRLPHEAERMQHRMEEAVVYWLSSHLPPQSLLFVDDAPRLDAGSLALILRLARVFTVVAAARSEELSPAHPLHAAFHELAREQKADRLRLERLPNVAVEALIGQLAQRDLPALTVELAQRTAGNPLFLIAALQALFEEGALYVDTEGRWAHTAGEITIPASVQVMIEQRLGRLARDQRRVFDAIAVIAQDFDFTLLQQVVKRDEVSLLNALDGLLERGLVTEPRSRGRGEFAPAHDLYVEVARATLPRARWRRLHGQVADGLRALYADDPSFSARLAYHYYEAGRVTECVPYSVLAGELALERYAPQQASSHFENAARWAEAAGWTPESPWQTRLHMGWAESLRRSGQMEAALTHYLVALTHAEGPMKLALIYQVAALQTARGDGPQAFARLADRLEAELSEPWMVGLLRCSQAFWTALRGEPQRARQYAAQGWHILRHVPQSEDIPAWTIDRATIILARTHALWGEWQHARRYAERALARNLARADAYGIADAHATLAQAYHGLREWARATLHAERALALAEEAGDPRLQGKALYPLALAMLREGPEADVRPLIHRLYAIAEETGDLEPLARGKYLEAQLLYHKEDLQPARDLLEALLVKARGAGVPLYLVMTLRKLAQVQLAAGNAPAARALADEALVLAKRCHMRHEVAHLRSLSAWIEKRRTSE